MKRTADFHDVWLNEDLGQNSRRVSTIVRLVAKEAQKQGIPCKPAKFSIRVKDKKFDENNFDELPETLTLHDVKTITMGDFIVYQSEHSKFSNFYPCEFRVGKHIYSSAEQAYHHIRARAHHKYAIALKILLSRKPREIKKYGEEIEDSEEWLEERLDVMLMCLTKKFEHCPDLAETLMKTKGYRLVEATPDRFWAAGATLSSNVLRRKQFTGANKQGHLLEMVRDLLIKRASEEIK